MITTISQFIQRSSVEKFCIPIVLSSELREGALGLYHFCDSKTVILQTYIIGKVQNKNRIRIYPVVSTYNNVALVADCPIEFVLKERGWEAADYQGHFHGFHLSNSLVKRTFCINGEFRELNGIERF